MDEVYDQDFKEMFLPTYSSPLNPIEILWSVVKRRWTKNLYRFTQEISNLRPKSMVTKATMCEIRGLIGMLICIVKGFILFRVNTRSYREEHSSVPLRSDARRPSGKPCLRSELPLAVVLAAGGHEIIPWRRLHVGLAQLLGQILHRRIGGRELLRGAKLGAILGPGGLRHGELADLGETGIHAVAHLGTGVT